MAIIKDLSQCYHGMRVKFNRDGLVIKGRISYYENLVYVCYTHGTSDMWHQPEIEDFGHINKHNIKIGTVQICGCLHDLRTDHNVKPTLHQKWRDL